MSDYMAADNHIGGKIPRSAAQALTAGCYDSLENPPCLRPRDVVNTPYTPENAEGFRVFYAQTPGKS